MADSKHIPARDARDRLIDLLGFGETYPLRDVEVRDERLTVPLDTSAKIPVETSQRRVRYQLRGLEDDALIMREQDGELVPAEAIGNGETIILETPRIEKDVTYNIRAEKIDTERAAYLHQQATVKVGIDVTLDARIRIDPPATILLDPGIENPANLDARLVDHGAQVEVEIDSSQEGVDYRLVHGAPGQEQELSQADVRGNLRTIVLQTRPVYEDIDIQIRATKTFERSEDRTENRETRTDLLEAILPLKVRARRDIPLDVAPSPVIDFDHQATVRLGETQRSASYQLYIRAIPDGDFVFPGDPAAEVLQVDVDGEPRVQVRRPPRAAVWQDMEGFAPLGHARPGKGGELELPLGALSDDSVILVRAHKDHQAAVVIRSAIQLEHVAVVLVRPDPEPALRLGVWMEGAETSGALEAMGGQPGVFYHLRSEPEGADLGLPAYFHKRDDRDASSNKGIGQLRVEVDMAIARAVSDPRAGDLASTPPPSPIVDTGRLAADTTLHVHAAKAQTRIAVPLQRVARLAAIPEIGAEQAQVDAGSAARILVRASEVGERYQLTWNGQPVGDVLDGNGEDLSFTTEPLSQDTSFEVRVTQPGDPGIAVERRVAIDIAVRSET
jgi:hypothetical protein